MNRIAIIGSNSFSGASFAAYCLKQGWQVLGASRSPQPADAFLPYRWLPDELQGRFGFVQCDLNTQIASLMQALDRFEPAIVVNFAAQSMVAQSWLHPEHWYRTNVLANVRLHEELRQRRWLEKYVHVSTPEVYGDTTGIADESAPFSPSTPYAASRAACDLHLRTFHAHYGFPVVWTRAANVYGPGQQLYRIIPRTIMCALSGDRLKLEGGGLSVRSFIHIADVAAATLALATRAEPGECYHIATRETVAIRDLVRLICNEMDIDFEALVETAAERPGKDAAYRLSSDKLRAAFGWSDTIPLRSGIRETIAWVEREHGELRRQPVGYVHKA